MSGARSGQVLDDYQRPVPGAKIYVYNPDGTDAVLTTDGITPLTQPVLTDEFGNYTYWAADLFYREDIWFGGKLRYRQSGIAVGLAVEQLGDEANARIAADANLQTQAAANAGAIATEQAARIGGDNAEAAARNTQVLQLLALAKGDPGGNAMAVGTATAVPTLTIPVGTDLIKTSGYASPGDYGAAEYISITAPIADWWWPYLRSRWMFQSLNGRWWMLNPAQIISPEMVGAVGNAEHRDGTLTSNVYYSDDPTIWQSDQYTGPNGVGTPADDYDAFRCLTDYITWLGGGVHVSNRPGAIYWFADPRKWVNGVNTKYQVKRRDLRIIERIEDYDDGIATNNPKWNPALDGVDSLVWDFNGSRWVQAPYYVPQAGTAADGTPKWDARGLRLYKCKNIRFNGFRFDMQWRRHTSWSGRAFQRNSWGLKLLGCKEVICDGGWIFDSPFDCLYTYHRFLSGVGGEAATLDPDLTNTPATSGNTDWMGNVVTGNLYWPEGECRDIEFRNFRLLHGARQGWSPVGGRKILFTGGEIRGAQHYLGTAPLNTQGAPGMGLANWRLPPLSPGCAVDCEPGSNQQLGQINDITFVGTKFSDNFSFISGTGQGEFTRQQYTFTDAAVDVAANTITIASNLLPMAILQERVRVYNSGGSLPGGLAPFTNYWVGKVNANDAAFTLHRSRRDAINRVNPVDITSAAGGGTHNIAVFRSKSQVNNIWCIGCEFDHPETGGDLFPGDITNFKVSGGKLMNRSRSRGLGDKASNYQSSFSWKGTEFISYGPMINSDDTTFSKTVTATATAPGVISGTALSLNDTGFGFTRVRLSSTLTLPAPLQFNTDYWATYVDANTCWLSVTEMDAKLGNYIAFTTTGTGTITLFQQGSVWNFDDCSFTSALPDQGFQFDCALDVDLTNNTINFPDAHEVGLVSENSLRFFTYPGATLPAPLATNTSYFPVAVDETRIIVCSSQANASANPPVPIDLTALGSGFAKMTSTGQFITFINQRGRFNNCRVFISRHSYPTGLTSMDFMSFTRSMDVDNVTFDTDLLPSEGYFTVDFSNVEKLGRVRYPASGTFRPKTFTGNVVAFRTTKPDPVTLWTTNVNQTWDPTRDAETAIFAFAGAMTVARTVTLNTTGAYDRQRAVIVRSAAMTGALNITVNGADILANPGEWVEYYFDAQAVAWVLLRRK